MTSVSPLLADHPLTGSVETKLFNPPCHPHRLPLQLPRNVLLLRTTGNERTGVREIIAEEISGYGGCHLHQVEVRVEIVMADGKGLLGERARPRLRFLVHDENTLRVTIGRKRSRGRPCLPF